MDVDKVVLDTSVIVAAFRSRNGASNALLQRVAEGKLKPLISTALFLEYQDALLRPEQRLASGLSETDVEAILAALASAALPVDIHFLWRPQLRDPADEFVLEAAVNGHADALVTHNIRDFRVATEAFGLRVMTPATCLKEIEDE